MADEVKIIRLVIDSSKAVDGSAAATRALASIASAMSKMDDALGRIGNTLKAQLILQATEFAGRLVQLAKSAFDSAAGLQEMADKMGITAQGLQALQYAAVQGGANFEKLETAVSKFSQKIGEAAGGSKEAIDAFTQLGVKLLDIHGNLVPTEALLERTARAITAIDDPAKQVAASVSVFGKAGAQMIPMLADVAAGMDQLQAKAKAAGVVISDSAIAKLDALADRSSVAALKVRALFAELGAPIATAAMEAVNSLIGKILNGLKALGEFARTQTAKDISQDILPQWDKDIAKQEAVVANRRSALNELSGSKGYNERYQALVQEQLKLDSYKASRSQQAQRLAQLEAGPAQYATELLVSGTFPKEAPEGAGQPTATGGGESPEEKWRRYTQELTNSAAAQEKMTAAARAGDQAFEQQKATVDAQNKALDTFKTQLADTDPRLTKVRDLLIGIAQGKAAEAFNVATTELQKQNVILQAQIDLIGQAPEIQAKEIALIKAKQEAEKAGNALSADDIEKRRQAIEQNEKLKIQAEDLKKAQELWTAPLKQALQDIQRIGADAFDKFLETGKFSFDELQKVFTTTIRRMAAEFLALATIRPVMSVLVNAISPSMASQMGFSSASGMSSAMGGGGGMLSMGGMGGIGSWLSSPIMPGDPYAGLFGGPAATAGLGGLTWGGGIAGAAGIGAGIYGLLSSKTPSGMIGSGLGIVGSGIGLASAAGLLPMLGAAGGPIGIGIGALGAILASTGLLDGLLGGGAPPVITNQTYGQLSYGSGGWYTTGGAWGPNANASATQQGLAGLGGGISSVLGLLGGVKDPSKVWGLSAMNKTVSGKDWSSSSDSTFLVDPNGNQTLWRMNESNMMDTGAEQVARASILGGAVGDITENMRKAVQSIGETTSATLQELATAITEVKAFDDAIKNLGKTTTTAEQAITQIDQQFASLYDTASKYGFATGDLDTAKAKARLGVATSFGSDISKQILQLTDPTAAAIADLDAWKADLVKNNQYLLDNVVGALDSINDIERLYGLKRAEIVNQGLSQSLAGIKDVITRLTYGDLSGASPTATLSGLTGSYNSMLAQANAGSATAVAGIGNAAASLAQFAGTYYGTSTPAYQNLVGGLRGDLASVYVGQGGSASDLPGALASTVTGLATVSGQLGELVATISNSNESDEELKATMQDILTQLTLILAKVA